MLVEANIDALVGPTHHFGGLGSGNIASIQHAGQISNPREAALEGLSKANLVAGLGVPQFVWLPPVRPRWELLTNLGYAVEHAVSDQLQQVLEQAHQQSPRALSAAFSSAFMWAANAATFSPAADAADRRNHCTPANLLSSWHRSFEAAERAADLNHLFCDQSNCTLHDPLTSILPLRDEGAANHLRLCNATGDIGFNVFVYGEQEGQPVTSTFIPRQTRASSEAIARRHQLSPERTFFLQQHPDAIAAGVFHNDVIATSHQHLLIYHERAFLDGEQELNRLEAAFLQLASQPLQRIIISNNDLSLEDAVTSYFFNSQIVTPKNDDHRDQPRMILICPSPCQDLPATHHLIDRLVSDEAAPIDDVYYVILRQSMANGGGPACLRLRVQVDEARLNRLSPNLRITSQTADRLAALIEKHYPTSLSLNDFVNADFVEHVRHTAAEMRRVMLGASTSEWSAITPDGE